MKFFNYHHLDILEDEPDFQIDEVLEISERFNSVLNKKIRRN